MLLLDSFIFLEVDFKQLIDKYLLLYYFKPNRIDKDIPVL